MSSTSRTGQGELWVRSNVSDTEIWIDESYVSVLEHNGSSAAHRGLHQWKRFKLRAGKHRVEIRHDNHHAHYEIVTIDPANPARLDVELAKRFE